MAAFIEAAVRDEKKVIWTYSDLAKAIDRKGQHRLLGGPLDILRDICRENGLPDVATVVVTKESLLDGTLMPSRQALEKYGGWHGLREEQARVISFNWSSVPGP
jgi:hypothetical protein